MAYGVGYTTQVGASATVANILTGTNLEKAPGRGIYRVTGRHATAAGTIVLSAWRGTDQVLDRIPMQAAAGGPNKTDDLLGEFAVQMGMAVRVSLTETAAAATIPSIRVEYIPR